MPGLALQLSQLNIEPIEAGVVQAAGRGAIVDHALLPAFGPDKG